MFYLNLSSYVILHQSKHTISGRNILNYEVKATFPRKLYNTRVSFISNKIQQRYVPPFPGGCFIWSLTPIMAHFVNDPINKTTRYSQPFKMLLHIQLWWWGLRPRFRSAVSLTQRCSGGSMLMFLFSRHRRRKLKLTITLERMLLWKQQQASKLDNFASLSDVLRVSR